jgi:hypothetical protein
MKISDECGLDYFNRNFKSGCVIYWYCSFIKPRPKYKYLFVCCVEPLLLFPINTDITDYVKNQNIVNTQVALNKSSHIFLKHDSYIDCHDVFSETNLLYPIKFEDLKNNAINDDNTCVKGEVNFETIKKVVETVAAGKTLRKREKDLIIQSLSQIIL